MRAVLLIIASFMLSLGTAGTANACSPVFKAWWQNKSASPNPDCSFDGGGRHDWTSGEATRDLGDGRVLQIIHDLHSPEQAIITDCSASLQIVVTNPEGRESSCGFWSNIDEHISPRGDLDLTRGESLKELAIYVEGEGFTLASFQWVVGNVGDELRPRDIPDFYCGCRLHYPDSPGANQ